MSLLATVAGTVSTATQPSAEAGLVFNGFWIVIAALNFLVFLVILQVFAFGPISRLLDERRRRIEQGLKDADVARREREAASDERQALLHEARQEANEIIARAQRAADEVREQELQATRQELERLREQAAGDLAAERQRALSEVRGQIADLALQAAGKVVGETRTGKRERRLVEEFLAEVGPAGPAGRT